MNIQGLLERVGFNHHESSIYLQLLQSGERAASDVARAARLPRSTVRNTLDALCTRGVVRKIYRRNTQYYRIDDPKALLSHLRHTLEETKENMGTLERAMPQLSAMIRKDAPIPKVRFYEGQAGVIEAFNHSLFIDDVKEILFFTSYSFIRDKLILRNDDEFYIPLRVKKRIRMRVLVGKRKDLDPRKKYNDPAELRERRYIPEQFALPGNLHIYGNFVVYFSADKGEYMAVLVESAMMADTMRALFNFVWEQCKPL